MGAEATAKELPRLGLVPRRSTAATASSDALAG